MELKEENLTENINALCNERNEIAQLIVETNNDLIKSYLKELFDIKTEELHFLTRNSK